MALNLGEIRRILNREEISLPVDNFRVIDSWAEYEEGGDNLNKIALKYMCYELEVMNPETGEKIHLFKALKFYRVIRVPKSAKQSTALMDMHSQILSAVYENDYNFVTVIANILRPALGLLFLYGVQGVASTIEEAKRRAEHDAIGLGRAIVGTYRVMELRALNAEESEWLREKLLSMDYLTVVRGIPKASETGEDGGNRGMGGKNINPDSQGTLEEFLSGMQDYEYMIQILSTPVPKDTLTSMVYKTEQEMTDWNSQLQGQTSLSMSLSLPMMYGANNATSEGWNKSYSNTDSTNYSVGESYTTSMGENASTSLSNSLGESFGTSHTISNSVSESQSYSISNGHTVGETIGHTVGETVGHTVGQTFGKTFGETLGQTVGQTVGQTIGQTTGQTLGQTIGQTSGQTLGQTLGETQGHTLGETQGHTLGQTAGQTMGQTLGQTLGQTMGHTAGISESTGQSIGHSDGTSVGESLNISQTAGQTESMSEGQSLSHSDGTSVSASHGVTSGNSYTVGNSETTSTSESVSLSSSHGVSAGQSSTIGSSSSTSQSYSESDSASTSQSLSTGQSGSESYSHGVSSGNSWNSGNSESTSLGGSITANANTSVGQNMGASAFGMSGGLSASDSAGTSYASNNSSTSGTSTSVGGSVSYSDTGSASNGWSASQSDSSSLGHSVSNGISTSNGSSYSSGSSYSESSTYGSSESYSASNGQSISQSYGSSQSESNSLSTGQTSSDSWGSNISHGTSNSYSNGISQGQSSSVTSSDSYSESTSHGTSVSLSSSESQSLSTSNSMSDSFSRSLSDSYSSSLSDSYSSSMSDSYSRSLSDSYSQSASQSVSESVSQSTSQSVSNSYSQSASNSFSNSYSDSYSQSDSNSYSQSTSESVSESNGTTHGTSQGISDGTSESTSHTTTQGTSNGTSQSVSNGTTKSNGWGNSISNSNGITGTTSAGFSASMGIAPSIGYNRSHQWMDQQVKDILELLEFQNERLKKALRGAGAFYTYVYIACPSLEALAAASAVAKSTWQNENAMVSPVQVLNLEPQEQKHILYHFTAFSSDITKERVGGEDAYKYCTMLLPKEFCAYTHPPRISIGGVFAEVNDIPKFSVPSMMDGEIYMGKVLSPEAWSIKHGYKTAYDYRISEKELMHGFITGASRSGKTVAAMRFVAELSKIRRSKTGKRLRIVAMDPKHDWRALARFVEPERFRFYSLGNKNFRPINFNPCKIPHGVQPQYWIDGIIDIYCRAYGLLERGKQLLAEVLYSLYSEAGVFDVCDQEGWEYKVPERSAKVTLPKAYEKLVIMKNQMEAGTGKAGKGGTDTRDMYSRLIERMQCFSREFSIERRLFGNEDGLGVDELIGADDVTVFESEGLENTFSSFIFGVITSGFYKVAKSIENGYLNDDQYETVLVIEEANKVLVGNDAAGTGAKGGVSLQGQSEFEEILDQSAGYGLFIFAITQEISKMPSTIVANSGLKFIGRVANEMDVTTCIRSVAREERYEDRDLVKWLPKMEIGQFICQSVRGFDYKMADPVLVSVSPLDVVSPTNAQIEEMMAFRDRKR